MNLLSFILVLCVAKSALSIEQPSYEVLKSIGNNIEIRKYAASKWVGTSASGKLGELRSSRSSLFNKLFNYISGQNSQQAKIDMTAPVLMDFSNFKNNDVKKDAQCDMTMLFYVPKADQTNTPVPTNPDVSIQSEPETIFAVLRFSSNGEAPLEEFLAKRDDLINALGQEAALYDVVNFITAGYDAPYVIFNRRNEVLFRKI